MVSDCDDQLSSFVLLSFIEVVRYINELHYVFSGVI